MKRKRKTKEPDKAALLRERLAVLPRDRRYRRCVCRVCELPERAVVDAAIRDSTHSQNQIVAALREVGHENINRRNLTYHIEWGHVERSA